MKGLTSFKGKTALVTGASRGIGRSIAQRLAEMGFNLVLTARSGEKLRELEKRIKGLGVECESLPLDLSEKEAPEKIIRITQETFNSLHVVVNNAASSGGGRLQDADLERWDRCLDLNFRAAVHLTRLGLPLMSKNDWGAVINISSISAHRPSGGAAMYSATKHALNGFSHSIFEDIREQGIKVVCITPGFVATDLIAKYNLASENLIQPDDVADAVSYALNCSGTVCPTEIILRPQKSPHQAKGANT